MQAFTDSMSSRSSSRDYPAAQKQIDSSGESQSLPDLLPISCGYFKNILLKILLKQRKQVLKYLLLDTQGRTFDQLLKYIRYHSLADLLMELMQLSVVYQHAASAVGSASQVFDAEAGKDGADGDKSAQNGEAGDAKDEDNILMKQAPSMSGEQAQMYRILQQKKVMVVDGLLGVLSHKNRSNVDDSINATEILIEIVEIEKTFDIFMMNKADKVGTIMELAVDCSNSFNQRYLLQILHAVSKQLKSVHEQQNVFKDLDEDGQETTNETKKN